jgi:two-component system OmpR family response regulator
MWKILIVEDDEGMREFLHDVMDMLGYQVCEAATGGQAVQAAEQFKPDLVVQDIMLPDCDGWTVMKRIRSLEGFSTLPAVFCSGSVQARDDFRSFPPPASSFLYKPFDVDDLDKAIKSLLAGEQGKETNSSDPWAGRFS